MSLPKLLRLICFDKVKPSNLKLIVRMCKLKLSKKKQISLYKFRVFSKASIKNVKHRKKKFPFPAKPQKSSFRIWPFKLLKCQKKLNRVRLNLKIKVVRFKLN